MENNVEAIKSWARGLQDSLNSFRSIIDSTIKDLPEDQRKEVDKALSDLDKERDKLAIAVQKANNYNP